MILTAAISANAKQGLATKVAENDSTATATNKPVKTEPAVPESSVVDEVIWVVGDEPILK